jgi:proteasome lid subunit RPN8/RPN11
MKLALPQALRAGIEAQARTAYPAECCGLVEGALVEGRADGEVMWALALHPARNIAERRDRFEIHPADHFAALRAARANGHAIIGCYHSHPGGIAQPSPTDRAAAGEENFIWLIAAIAKADAPVSLGAFVYSRAGFLPLDLLGPR